MSKHSTSSNAALQLVYRCSGMACLCLLLSGCPSASTPTQPQTSPPPSSPPPPAGSSGTSGTSSSPSQPSASAPASGSGQEEGSSSTESAAADAAAGREELPDLRDEEPGLEGSTGAVAQSPGATGEKTRAASGSSGAGQPGGQAPGSSNGGPLTPTEQVAILDAQLEQGAGKFDAIIQKTEAEQRAAARAQARRTTVIASKAGTGEVEDGSPEAGGAGEGGAGEGDNPYEDGMADAGGNSGDSGAGGGMRGGGSGAPDTAKYPPPADIPSGSDDDVVARQLREAAERESDPAVRAKLWDEYRKYKGIEK